MTHLCTYQRSSLPLLPICTIHTLRQESANPRKLCSSVVWQVASQVLAVSGVGVFRGYAISQHVGSVDAVFRNLGANLHPDLID